MSNFVSKDNLGKNILAIIPARAGSKGLPGKNIKPLNNKPLLVYSIDQANGSRYITRLILSTEDQQIANLCSNYNIEIPFIRPKELATDNALSITCYTYTLERLKREFNYNADIVVILQPTSPLRTIEDIDKCIKLLLDNDADSVISVSEIEPIERARSINQDGKLINYLKSEITIRNRADYKKVYGPNGAVFVVKPEILKKDTFYSDNTYPYIMPKERSIDIDTQFDFDIAEFMVKEGKFSTG